MPHLDARGEDSHTDAHTPRARRCKLQRPVERDPYVCMPESGSTRAVTSPRHATSCVAHPVRSEGGKDIRSCTTHTGKCRGPCTRPRANTVPSQRGVRNDGSCCVMSGHAHAAEHAADSRPECVETARLQTRRRKADSRTFAPEEVPTHAHSMAPSNKRQSPNNGQRPSISTHPWCQSVRLLYKTLICLA
jgi:hypothetical protein